MEETITIEKTYTKKEAFIRFIQLSNGIPQSRIGDDEYDKLIDFLGIRDLV